MSVELDDCIGVAIARLHRLPDFLEVDTRSIPEHRALLGGANAVLDQARLWIASRAGAAPADVSDAWAGTPTAALIRGPLRGIGAARHLLGSTIGTPVPIRENGAAQHFTDAARLLRLGRDLMRTHFDPDGGPLTDYGRLSTTPGAHLYVLAQMSEVCHHTAAALRVITVAAPTELRTDRPQIAAATLALERTVVASRRATRGAPGALATLPAAVTLTPDPLHADETPASRMRLIREGCERLRQGADRAAHRSDSAPGISGSDLVQMARPLALAHLLAGRLLHTVAPHAPGVLSEEADHLATALRETARAWQDTARAWTRLVDLGDARAADVSSPPQGSATKLYEYRRGNARVPLPKQSAHPAVTDSQYLAVRVGQLLFTGDWSPEKPGSAVPRPPERILAETNGPEALLATLHRLPSAAHTLAAQAPALLSRIAPRLVTDDQELRPQDQPGVYRWFPAAPSQLARLADVYRTAALASEVTAQHLQTAAYSLRIAMPHARLDPTAPQRVAVRPPTSAPRLPPPAGPRWVTN